MKQAATFMDIMISESDDEQYNNRNRFRRLGEKKRNKVKSLFLASFYGLDIFLYLFCHLRWNRDKFFLSFPNVLFWKRKV